MDSDYYRIKVEEQLNDSTFYSEIPDNIDHLVKRRMNTVLNKYTTATTEKEYDYLKNFERKTSNFYGLPKIHKSKEIQSAINSQQNEYIKVQKPTDLKLRPIIAGPASPTHRLSNFLDIILKPLCKYVPSYIRDDIDFLSHLPKIAPVHARLVSFDVTSLYTNIPHDLGIEAIQYWVAKHRDAIPNRFTVDFILDSTKLILENNSFYFNGKNYLQHRGTAMGTKFAPTYATLVMGFLEQRLNDKSIVIKQADKGGAIVIMDSDYYRIKVEEQLNDSTFYSEIPDNIDHLVKRRMNTVLNKYTTATTEKEYDYLKNFERKTSNFYGLPKIHKSKEIQSAINSQQNEYMKVQKPTDLKLRPIIAGPASPTHRLSNFLDIILKPLCKYVPSYIRDDIDFLSHLPKIAPVHARLVSFDVTSLYTNIPHDLGIEAIQYWVAKHRDAIPNRFTVDFILDSTKLILENNSFYFNGKNYLQHRGTAMGTKFAPTYATLVMGFLEQRLFTDARKCSQQSGWGLHNGE
ncbi:unnamed protein product [Mytilus edulis]|uniref:Reverse transcriptase domain-containing protein n=1 Tax=Mytilus edulis TaxID=6550 RepID=A0A8S3SEX0_MYTED|nr:unnamed protein product [Mytilus edulis]